MTKYDKSDASYSKVKGAKGVTGIKSSISHGQHKAPSESAYPGMADSTPQEKDKTQSAR
jgi:hypothetical protein